MSIGTMSPAVVDDRAQLGNKILHTKVEPHALPIHAGKYVAIDVLTEAYEIDEDGHTAITRLRLLYPDAEIWFARIGHPTRIGMHRC